MLLRNYLSQSFIDVIRLIVMNNVLHRHNHVVSCLYHLVDVNNNFILYMKELYVCNRKIHYGFIENNGLNRTNKTLQDISYLFFMFLWFLINDSNIYPNYEWITYLMRLLSVFLIQDNGWRRKKSNVSKKSISYRISEIWSKSE